VKAEFQDLDLEATMGTMAKDPYVQEHPKNAIFHGSA